MSDLQEAIEHLYETFGSYRASAVAGCPCCVSAKEQARLHAKRLRQLSEEDLGSYAFSALDTWGTLTDLKHFLPRILELKAMGEMWTDLQVIYGKFVREGVWPEVERRALERFTRALLVGAAPRAGACWMSDIIESAGLSGMDVRGLLDEGFAPRGGFLEPVRATQLADLVMSRADALASGRLGWIWWRSEDATVVETWLLSGRAYGVLMGAFEAQPDHADAGGWAAACDVLEALGGYLLSGRAASAGNELKSWRETCVS